MNIWYHVPTAKEMPQLQKTSKNMLHIYANMSSLYYTKYDNIRHHLQVGTQYYMYISSSVAIVIK
jgi:hypothetical protein